MIICPELHVLHQLFLNVLGTVTELVLYYDDNTPDLLAIPASLNLHTPAMYTTVKSFSVSNWMGAEPNNNKASRSRYQQERRGNVLVFE